MLILQMELCKKSMKPTKNRLKFIEKLGLRERFGRPALIRDLAKAKDGLAGDLAFISKGIYLNIIARC